MKRKLLGTSLLAALLLGTLTACGQPGEETPATGASPDLALPSPATGITDGLEASPMASPSPATTE